MDRPVLFILLLSIFIVLLGVGIIVPLMPLYAARLGATGFALGLMVAGFSISRGVLQPFVGTLSDRLGRKGFLVAGLSIYALAGTAYTFAFSVEHLVLIRIFHGVGSAMVIPIAMAYIGDLSPQGSEGKYMGRLNIALFAGIGGGPVIGGIFLDVLGMNSAFYVMSALSGASVVLVAVFLPSSRPERGRTAPRLLATFAKMLRNGRVVGLLVSRMATMFILVPTMAFLPILMARFMRATGVEIGMVIASRTLVNAAMQGLFGRIVDRYNKMLLLSIGSLIISATIFLAPFAEDFINLIILFAITGIGEALVWPTLGALAIEEGRYYGQGAIMGVFNMAMSFGVFVGSMAAGTIMDLMGLSYAFFTTALFLLFSTAVAVTLINRSADAAGLGLEKPPSLDPDRRP
jgi:MFS family permease